MGRGINIGSTGIDNIYQGSTVVDKVYIGDKLVWPAWSDPTTYTNIYATTRGDLPGLKKSVYCAANSSIWFKLNQSSGGTIRIGIGAINSDGSTNSNRGSISYYGYDSSGNMIKIGDASIGDRFVVVNYSNSNSPYTSWVKYTADSSHGQYVAIMYTVDSTISNYLYVSDLTGAQNHASFDLGTIYQNKFYYTCAFRVPELAGNNLFTYYYTANYYINTASTTVDLRLGRRTYNGTDYSVWNTTFVDSDGLCPGNKSTNHQNWNNTGYPAIDWVYMATGVGTTQCI